MIRHDSDETGSQIGNCTDFGAKGASNGVISPERGDLNRQLQQN
jgi:hypothetical protein